MSEYASKKLKILVFGVAQDSIGKQSIELEAGSEISTVGQLKSLLVSKYPELGTTASFFVAVNAEYADDVTKITPTDEIAIIPPTSGG